nr:S41 family peptidase [uncultured Fluviicola sp.]
MKPCFVHAQSPEKMNPKEIKLLIDSLGNALNRLYIYPDQATRMVQSIKKNYKNGLYNGIKDKTELCYQLMKDLQQVHKDGHLSMVYDPGFANLLETTMTDEERQQNFEYDLKNHRENNFSFTKTEILPGNIGYLRWDGFSGFVEEAKPTFDAAFQFVGNCKALIIDMRYNGGGSPPMVLQTESYFFEQKTRMNDIVDRNMDTVKGWTDPNISNFKLKMPVYILTSHYTFSGAEDFTYGMQQVKRAVVVGDTTGGGAHPTGSFSIGQGFVMDIPTHRSPNIISKTDWEGTGVRPDFAVASELALQKAQELIFNDFLSKTTDERERQSIQWNLTSLENRTLLTKQLQEGTIKLTNEVLLSYCGEYHPSEPNSGLPVMTIFLNGGNLYRRYEGSQDLRLIPISATKFVYTDDSGRSMDFEVTENEKISNLVLSNQRGKFTLTTKQ